MSVRHAARLSAPAIAGISLGNDGAPIWLITGTVAIGLVLGLLVLHGLPRIVPAERRRPRR